MRRLLLLPLLVAGLGCNDDGPSIQRAPYDLVALPGQFDFGSVALGGAVTATVTIQNLGSGSAEVAQTTLGGGGGGNFILPSSFNGEIAGNGGAVDVEIVFEPQAEQWFEDSLLLAIVTNEDSEVFTVPLRGEGVDQGLRAWPAVVDFGPVPEDDSRTRVLTLENLTDNVIELQQPTFDGDDIGFSVRDPLEFETPPWPIEAADTFDLTLEFVAVSEEGQEASVGFLGPAGNNWGLEVELIANVCEGSADPDWDDDGDGFAVCAGDCDDNDDTSHPGAAEQPDLTDNDCDGIVDEGTDLYDDDGDGFSEAAGDCDDGYDQSFPGADEAADGRDNDCDGDVDEGTTADDSDGDGWTIPAGDCDESNPLVYPGAEELEDAIDNDCDTTIDETTSVYDDDGDGFCDNAVACLNAWAPLDCNDGDPNAFPGAIETVNGIDDDCNGIVDDGTPAYDNDGDGYTQLGGDCNDSDASVYPGAVELPDSLDNDCDGTFDEDTAFSDDDGDGFTENGGDCNDASPLVYPGAPEDLDAAVVGAGDGIDNDCDTIVDEGTTSYDDDGDGFSEQGGDCDDDNDDFSPGEWDAPGDGFDWDCDGVD